MFQAYQHYLQSREKEMYAKMTQGPSIPKYRPSTVNYNTGYSRKLPSDTMAIQTSNFNNCMMMADAIPPLTAHQNNGTYDGMLTKKTVTANRGIRGSLNATGGFGQHILAVGSAKTRDSLVTTATGYVASSQRQSLGSGSFPYYGGKENYNPIEAHAKRRNSSSKSGKRMGYNGKAVLNMTNSGPDYDVKMKVACEVNINKPMTAETGRRRANTIEA